MTRILKILERVINMDDLVSTRSSSTDTEGRAITGRGFRIANSFTSTIKLCSYTTSKPNTEPLWPTLSHWYSVHSVVYTVKCFRFCRTRLESLNPSVFLPIEDMCCSATTLFGREATLTPRNTRSTTRAPLKWFR